MLPGAFMPGATEASVLKLSELGTDQRAQGRADLRQARRQPAAGRQHPGAGAGEAAGRATSSARIARTGDKWAGLIIDVPEEQIISDLALAAEMTKTLARCNVQLAIDDFGRGYSSLARLGELPFAELKLDRSFVTDCGTDKVNAPLCKTVIDLAHNFGRIAVAIGVEKAADAVALVSMGCDYGQGFLFGQPMPEERFISLLRQRAAAQGRSLPARARPSVTA